MAWFCSTFCSTAGDVVLLMVFAATAKAALLGAKSVKESVLLKVLERLAWLSRPWSELRPVELMVSERETGTVKKLLGYVSLL